METKLIYCPVLGASVTKVTHLDGTIMRIICAEYEPTNGGCRHMRSGCGAGPLTQLIERAAERAHARRRAACIFRAR